MRAASLRPSLLRPILRALDSLCRNAALALGLALCLAACSGQTRLVVRVDSDAPAAQLGAIELEASGIGAPATDRHSPDALPFSFVVLPPGGDASRTVDVVVRSTGALRIEQRASAVRFTAGQTRLLRLELRTECVSAACGEGETCRRGGCVSDEGATEAFAPGDDTSPYDPGLLDGGMDAGGVDAGPVDSGPSFDAGPPLDGGEPDAGEGVDSGLDAGPCGDPRVCELPPQGPTGDPGSLEVCSRQDDDGDGRIDEAIATTADGNDFRLGTHRTCAHSLPGRSAPVPLVAIVGDGAALGLARVQDRDVSLFYGDPANLGTNVGGIANTAPIGVAATIFEDKLTVATHDGTHVQLWSSAPQSTTPFEPVLGERIAAIAIAGAPLTLFVLTEAGMLHAGRVEFGSGADFSECGAGVFLDGVAPTLGAPLDATSLPDGTAFASVQRLLDTTSNFTVRTTHFTVPPTAPPTAPCAPSQFSTEVPPQSERLEALGVSVTTLRGNPLVAQAYRNHGLPAPREVTSIVELTPTLAVSRTTALQGLGGAITTDGTSRAMLLLDVGSTLVRHLVYVSEFDNAGSNGLGISLPDRPHDETLCAGCIDLAGYTEGERRVSAVRRLGCGLELPAFYCRFGRFDGADR